MFAGMRESRKILLVYPEFPRTYWGLQYGLEIAGRRATMPPLGLITVAALLPRAWQVRLIDMNIEPLSDADLLWADAVLVGGMLIQAPSMREIVRRARAQGRRTVVGGPAPSTAPGEFAEADVVFGGEAEGRVPELVALIEGETVPPAANGCRTAGPTLVPLRKEARPDVKGSPVPRFDLLRIDAYTTMSIQYSRGCPFRCEFCDIIEIFGRVPRLKTPAQVLAELEALCALGWRGSVFVVDDNFIGNVKELRKLLPELRRRGEDRAVDAFEARVVRMDNAAQLLDLSRDRHAKLSQLGQMRAVDRHAGRFGIDDGVERAAERHIHRNLAAADRHHQRRLEDEGRDVAERHGLDVNGIAVMGQVRARLHQACRGVVADVDRRRLAAVFMILRIRLAFATTLRRALPDQPALDRHRRDGDDAVAAHGAPAFVVHEEHAGMRIARHRFGQQRAVHVGVSARFEDQRLAQVIEPFHGPGALFQHGPAVRRRHALDDEPKRLPGRMGVDRPDTMNHSQRYYS